MRRPKNPVQGILEQFCELGGALAVALCDGQGRPIAMCGDSGATGALSAAIRRLIDDLPRKPGTAPVVELFADTDEFSVPRTDASSVSLLVRRVGEDWALVAVWSGETRANEIRSFAAETATRLEAVC
jgi:hypothetical protein